MSYTTFKDFFDEMNYIETNNYHPWFEAWSPASRHRTPKLKQTPGDNLQPVKIRSPPQVIASIEFVINGVE